MSIDLSINRRLSIAPMMDWTDRHFRFFVRLISKNVLLYTEMVTAQALHHSDPERHLAFNPEEHPCALQVGGSDPTLLAKAAMLGEQFGYKEVNLNVGCPSERVQSGSFGACLMAEPELVAECVAAMQESVEVPVTVKTRIGIDDSDSYAFLQRFIDTIVKSSQCKVFIIHARKAWLKGLSPKQNRNIPPLDYPRVHLLKTEFPDLNISINGGIKTIDEVQEHLQFVDGVMVGREAYKNPYFLVDADEHIFGHKITKIERIEIIEKMREYVSAQKERGVPPRYITRHMMGLFKGVPNAATWRKRLAAGEI